MVTLLFLKRAQIQECSRPLGLRVSGLSCKAVGNRFQPFLAIQAHYLFSNF